MRDHTPFYLTLPSDASMEMYPQNTASHWTTKLKHPIELPGRWEMALVEMQYLNSLFTLSQEMPVIVSIITKIAVTLKGDFVIEEEDKIIKIPPGNYKRDDALLNIMNKLAPTMKRSFYHSVRGELMDPGACEENKAFVLQHQSLFSNRLIFGLASPRVKVTFPPESLILQKMLGFDHSVLTKNNESSNERVQRLMSNLAKPPTIDEVVANRNVNRFLGNQTLFVYCDVADYSGIGDTTAPLLRTVPIKGSEGEVMENRFDIPHYVPVLRSFFETIQISFATDSGEDAKFETGKSLVKIHFRPLRY